MPPVFGVLFDGIAYGMLLFLLSVGLSVTLGMMNFVNLAHCSFAMLGGYVTVTLMDAWGWPFLVTLPAAFVVAAAATTLQWALDEGGLLSETMAFGNIILADTVLVAAGVYQWTPLKDACLRHCRSPLDFLLFHWRDSALGTVASGASVCRGS